MRIENIKFYDIKNQKIYQELNNIASNLENYAKRENIKIKFKYNPSGTDKADRQLNITVTDKGFLYERNSKETSILSDTEAITAFQPDKYHRYEETFSRRVYRAVSELTEQIKNMRIENEREYIEIMLRFQFNNKFLY